MNSKFKLTIIIILSLASFVFSLILLARTQRLTTANRQENESQAMASNIDFNEISQAVVWLESTRPLNFENLKTASPNITPSPTDSTTQKTTIQILNGSAIAGAAINLANQLETIDNIVITEVGNAPIADDTVLQSRKGVSEEIKKAE